MTAARVDPDQPRDECPGDGCNGCTGCWAPEGTDQHTAAPPASRGTDELREEIARWLMYRDENDWERAPEEIRGFYRSEADEFLREPSMRRLLDAEAAVRRDRTRQCSECGSEPAACVAARIKCCPDCTHTAAALAPAALAAVRRVQALVAQGEWRERASLARDFMGKPFPTSVGVGVLRRALGGEQP